MSVEMLQRMGIDQYELVASLCRESFYDFVLQFWEVLVNRPFLDNWHVKYLCDELQYMAELIFARKPKEYDLIINISPGSTKSTIVSIMLPAWMWTRMPDACVIGASHTYSLAVDLSRKNRMVVKSEKYMKCFPYIKVPLEQDAKGYFINTKNGMRFAAGIDGDVTGRHGDMILIDDPLDPKGGFSEALIETANTNIKETLANRKKDPMMNPIIIIMQRLAENDPTGMMLKDWPDPIKHICLPAELTKDVKPKECRKFYKNGIMFPARHPIEFLAREKKRERGGAYYAGQYLQQPIPRGGAMFHVDRFRIEPLPPVKFRSKMRYWDKACLVSGTGITTLRGVIPIENVFAGDYVLTRNGWSLVEDCWEAKQSEEIASVLFSDGRVLTGTPDHKIFIKNREKYWTDLQRLIISDEVLLDNEVLLWQEKGVQRQKCDFLMEDTITDINVMGRPKVNSDTSIATNGTKKLRNIDTEVYTGIYGKQHMVPYPKVVMSTTKTMTGIIMTFQIWNVYNQNNIEDYMQTNYLTRLRWQILSIVRKHLLLFDVPWQNQKDIIAKIVGMNFLQRVLRLNFVCPVGRNVAVYDISVKNNHEFFANGVLVHNSSKNSGMFTVGVLMGKDFNDMYWVLDVVRGQWDTYNREQIVRRTAEADGLSVRIGIEQEPGSSGKDSVEASIRNLGGFKVVADRPTGDKAERAEPYSTQVNAGHVMLISADWNHKYIEELRYFSRDNTKYKDQVDASSGAFKFVSRPVFRAGGWKL